MTFTVAVAGRPNVGKSTLFNRLVGKRLALVDDQPGVTRDRRSGNARIGDIKFEVIDTAGLEEADQASLEGRMRAQTEQAIIDANVTLFLIDARAGVTPMDKSFATMLRRAGKPVILVANKVEGRKGDDGFYEAFEMGFGEPVPISAEHGEGMADLRNALVEAVGEDVAFGKNEPTEDEKEEASFDLEAFEAEEDETEPEYDNTRPLKICIVGRPNAGKSTLINRMLGEDRLLTGPEAGITRDSISVDWEWQGRSIKLFDTAGMRRKARVQEKLEKLSVHDALRAIQYAEVVVIMFDATIPFEKQDLHIVDLIHREGRAPVLAFNKWDLVPDKQAALKELHEKTERLLPQLRGLRTVTLSGQSGKGLDRLMEAVIDADKTWNRRVATSKLNQWLDDVQAHHPPPAVSGRRIRFKYITQAKTRPPTFVAQCTRPEGLPASYERYLLNDLRATFKLPGVPLRLYLRKGENPYGNRKRNTSK
ncbi:ribosome biogenesis GTPase Der [Ahrensia sp. R2A130]|uniref:ribosome biogenesis GTPase Der n=1 Tax=Ahrensia sp. R2A130 TaxID=744979 RepID=UPI0001E0F04E|nr:ribosome biogenesis GTPase Der [Ahrensia sp. R2A130]EFL90964.1 ribosome-associated GTPase EngA [Ahrensia sp. R2A130]